MSSTEQGSEPKPLYHNKEWLREKYFEEGLTQEEMGSLAGVSQTCIGRNMRKQGIDTLPRGQGDSLSEETRGKLRNRDWLHQKHVVEGLTQKEIGDRLGVSQTSVGRRLRDHGIETKLGRNGTSLSKKSKQRLNDGDWLHREYITNGRTQEDLAEMLSVSQRHVSVKLREAGIKTRRGTYIHPPDVREKLSNPFWLFDQHCVEGRSTPELADELGVSSTTICNNMDRFGIDRIGKTKTVFEKECPQCSEPFQTDVSDDTMYCSFDCYRNSSSPTSIERVGWAVLDGLGIEYLKEHALNGYWTDAFLCNIDACVEFDGEYWHGHPESKPWTDEQVMIRQKDERKNRRLVREGYHVIRIWERHLNENIDALAEALSAELDELGGSPTVRRVP